MEDGRRRILYLDFARSTFRIGGGQVYLMNLVQELDKRAFAPCIYSLSDSTIFEQLLGVRVLPRARTFRVLDTFDAHGFRYLVSPRHLGALLAWLAYETRQLRAIVRREHIGLIHINGMLPLIVTCCSGLAFCRPTVYHVHHVIGSRMGLSLMDLLCCCVRRVLCVSAYARDASLRLSRSKGVVVYNGIRVGGPPPQEKDKTIVFAGSMIRLKGYPEFLAAIAIIQDVLRAQGYHVACCGDGVDRPAIEQIIAREQLGDIVRLCGFQKDVRSLMRRSRIVVNASIEPEGFGLTIVEGMEAGCLVIASCLGAPREIIEDGKNGWLVDPRDTRALAVRIEEAVLHYDEAATLRQAARATVCERFDLAQHVRCIEALYRSLLPAASQGSNRMKLIRKTNFSWGGDGLSAVLLLPGSQEQRLAAGIPETTRAAA